MGDKTRGLYGKFIIRRVDGQHEEGGRHFECDYFVLDLTHDVYAKAAILAYADSCEAEYPLLAADLRAKFPDLSALREQAQEPWNISKPDRRMHGPCQDHMRLNCPECYASPAPAGWQPIETAPMLSNWDGPWPVALVWSKKYGVSIGQAWRFPDGSAHANRGHGDSTITHWMPLPTPPTGAP